MRGVVDFRMLDGKPKATAIVRFDHSAVLIARGKKREFKSLGAMKIYKDKRGLEINIEHVHPAFPRDEKAKELKAYPEIRRSFMSTIKKIFKI